MTQETTVADAVDVFARASAFAVEADAWCRGVDDFAARVDALDARLAEMGGQS